MSAIQSFANIPHHLQYNRVHDFAMVLAAQLGIRVPHVVVGYHPFTGCLYDPTQKVIFLNAAQLDYEQASPLMVLAHEMRHAYQDQMGYLSIEDRWVDFESGMIIGRINEVVFKWKGEEFDPNGKYHHELPWEQDAIEYEEMIAHMIGVKPYRRPDRDAGLKSA
jgi:Putative neutral zinc metallopeptidase